jgi:hypothetical protein
MSDFQTNILLTFPHAHISYPSLMSSFYHSKIPRMPTSCFLHSYFQWYKGSEHVNFWDGTTLKDGSWNVYGDNKKYVILAHPSSYPVGKWVPSPEEKWLRHGNITHFYLVTKLKILSCVWVTKDRAWIVNHTYCTLTHTYTTHYWTSQLTITERLVFSVCYSLHQSLLSNGLQQWTFPFFWVPKPSPASATSFSQ